MVTEDCVDKYGPTTPRKPTMLPCGPPHWDAEHLGSYVALMRVCTMDIECLNKKSSSMSCYTGLYCQGWSCNSAETHCGPGWDPS
jgi:hypothetical protein